MKTKKRIAMLLIITMMTSVFQMPVNAQENNLSIESRKDDLTVSQKLENQWNDGYVATITITNSTKTVVKDWEIKLPMYNYIENIWNANIVASDELGYTIKCMSYNKIIEPGQSVNLGYIATGSFGDDKSLGGISLSDEQLSAFTETFYDSLSEDNVNLKNTENIGIKTKAAKIAAKKMLKKLYKIGSKSFDKAVKKAAGKLPKKIRKKVTKYINYSNISAVLNIVVNAEGTITDALESGLKKIGVPKTIASYGAKIIVFILL